MDYRETIAWLYGTQLRGIKPGLQNVRRLLDRLGVPLDRPRFLHVAGTNGKGSVCAMLDAVCRAQGYRCGLFTSPHLITFRERIRVNGAMISEPEVVAGLAKIRDIVFQWNPHPTFFELTTALALDFFHRERVEIVVLETGLGGRLDTTNVVHPVVSVLTAIDLDHQQWLGETLDKIALEKAGIIKAGVPAVSGPQRPEAAEVLTRVALEKGSWLEFITKPLERCAIGLAGSHQRINAAICVAALRSAEIEVSAEAVRSGLANVNWPGRFQQIGGCITLDGAHNPAATARLAKTWREIHGSRRATVILGILGDKDISGICAALTPIAERFIVTAVNSERSAQPEAIRQVIGQEGGVIPCTIAPDLEHALALAKETAESILVTGSLFLVGEALALLDPGKGGFESSLQ